MRAPIVACLLAGAILFSRNLVAAPRETTDAPAPSRTATTAPATPAVEDLAPSPRQVEQRRRNRLLGAGAIVGGVALVALAGGFIMFALGSYRDGAPLTDGQTRLRAAGVGTLIAGAALAVASVPLLVMGAREPTGSPPVAMPAPRVWLGAASVGLIWSF